MITDHKSQFFNCKLKIYFSGQDSVQKINKNTFKKNEFLFPWHVL